MLRLIAIILILGGFGAAIVWPLVTAQDSERSSVRGTIFSPKIDDPEPLWRSTTIELSPADNPVILAFSAEYIDNNQQLGEAMQYSLKLETGAKEVISGEFELLAQQPEASSADYKIYTFDLPEFEVDQTATYTVSLKPSSSAAQQLEKLGVSVRTAEQAPDDRFVKPGFAALGLGIVLWLFTTGRRTKTARSRREQKSRKWGRN
ncbi:MAG: hypothetical protein AAF362_21055 [Pseudomonadota bacterium]